MKKNTFYPFTLLPFYPILLCFLGLLIFLVIPAFAELTQGYVGAHWQTNPARHEIVNLIFNGAERRLISIGGFGDDFDLVFHPHKNYGWATNHKVFGPLVKIIPAQKDIRPVSGFEHPIDLGLSLADGNLWVLDGKKDEVALLDSNGKVLMRYGNLPKPHALAVSPKDSSAWIACENGLIKVSEAGKKVAQAEIDFTSTSKAARSTSTSKAARSTSTSKAARSTSTSKAARSTSTSKAARFPILSISSDLTDGGCWTAIAEKNQVIKFSAKGDRLFGVSFENLKGISTAPASGGCWVVDGAQVIKTTEDGKKSDVVIGYEEITSISRNLSDGTFWITDQKGKRVSKLPQDENEAVLAVIGLKDQTDSNLRMARHTAIRLTHGGSSPPVVEKPEPEEVDEPTEPKPSEISPAAEDTYTPEERPEQAQPESPSTSSPSAEKKQETPQISETDQPSEEQISQIPPKPKRPEKEFAGITFIELSEGLSQKRLENTAAVLGRRYVWNFEGETYTLLLGLDVETYNDYTNRERVSLAEMVLAEVPTTEKIATEFRKLSTSKGWNGEKLVSFVLAFVQSLPYTVDKVTTSCDEFIAYAYETFVAGGGDCEDTTILATSILIGLGYDTILLNPPGHLAFGVSGNYGGSYITHEDKKYFYCESTGTGWRIGQVPDVYQGADFRTISISEKE